MTDPPRIRVLIVDDHSVVRMGLRMFFELQPDIEVVGEAIDGSEGVALIRGVRAISPRSRVLLLSGSDGTCAPDATELADGVVRKTFRATELLSAILGAALLT